MLIKCHECGKTADVQTARQYWVWTWKGNVYCPGCIISLSRKLKGLEKPQFKIDKSMKGQP